MTIDEAISHAREVAEEKRKSKSANLAPEIISECELCAQEHEQLAKWLEEVQQYRAIGTPEECLRNKDFLDFLSDKMNPNDFETYLQMYNALDEKGNSEE